MAPIVSVVGRTNVGKTTFLEALVRELRSRGHRIGVIKHSHHSVEMDPPGTDTRRLTDVGGEPVVLASVGRLWATRAVQGEASPEAVADLFLGDVDLVLTEGYKRGAHPKIEVWRQSVGGDPLCQDGELIARVGDPWPSSSAPHFAMSDASGVAAFLEERYLQHRKQSLSVTVDGKQILLEGFALHIVTRTLLGMLSALKGVSADPSDIVIRWRRGK